MFLLKIDIPALGEVFMRYWRNFVLLVPKLILAILIIAAAIYFAIQLARLLNNRLKIHSADPLLVTFIAQIAKWIMILAGLMLGLAVVGFSDIVSGLIAGAGVSALIIGFAFKDIGENFLAGVILAFNRPFHVHDTIGIDSYMGQVVSLGIRSTCLKTADGRDVYIPNATIMKSTLTNFTADGNIRLDFKVLLDIATNTEQAAAAILDTVRSVKGVIDREEPFCTIEEFTANSVVLRVYFWMQTYNYRTETLAVKTRVMDTVLKSLVAGGYKVMGMPGA